MITTQFSGNSEMLDTLADLMTFGNIGRCNACKTGNLIFRSGVGYFCNGNISEWAKCTNIVEKPVRIEFKIPEELKKAYPFLKKYKYKKNGDREIVVSQTQSGNSTQGIKR
ncbi:Poly [ADP-ribose] polymerase [Armadillidium vulgare]|nr:Poly [ADP-ribose] polymerase [Armadillidium vulgare]